MSKSVLIITGGTRGIGASIARLASETGRYEIAVTYNSRAPVSLPPRTMAVKCDVSKEEDIVGLFRTVDSKLGRVTHLVNNAGILPPIARLDSYSSTRLHSVFTTNTIGPFLCAREAVLRMSTRYGGSGGSIVNLSSAAARIGSPNEFIDYAGSKAALDALTLGLSKEVAKEGVRVNAVRPGLIETEMHESSGDPKRLERLVPGVPMARAGTADEIAEAVLWLLSEKASYVTGTLLDVTGGR